MIKLSYQPSPRELGRASLLFAEKKPLLSVSIIFFNIIAALMALIIILKFVLININLQEFGLLLMCTLWLFFRKPFTSWALIRKMNSNKALLRPIDITVSKNGIVWGGSGLQDGKLNWDHIKYIIETKNGFIMPGSLTRFLWLPLNAFNAGGEIKQFREFISSHKIKLKKYKKWRC